MNIVLSGRSTGDTKRSAEAFLFAMPNAEIHNVGVYSSLGNGSGTYTAVNDTVTRAVPYTFNASGEDLMLHVAGIGLDSAQPMTVTVSGTDYTGAPMTGTAVFTTPEGTGRVAEDQTLQVLTPVVGGVYTKWGSVLGVTATNGAVGDTFDLRTFPAISASDVEIPFCDSVNVDLGTEVALVHYHYYGDHTKRIPRMGNFTAEGIYQNNEQGFSGFNNRTMLWRLEIRNNGQGLGTEYWFIDRAAGTASKRSGKGPDEIKESFKGFFSFLYIFS